MCLETGSRVRKGKGSYYFEYILSAQRYIPQVTVNAASEESHPFLVQMSPNIYKAASDR